jgi:hypothetical protein
MSDRDYQAFLEYLFETYVRPRLRQFHEYELMRSLKWRHHHREMMRIYEILRFIERRYGEKGTPDREFRAECLHDAIEETRRELRYAIRILEDAGYRDAIDDHFSEIVAGMTMEHMPAEEIAVMKSLGSDDPDRDLRAVMYMLRIRYSNPRQEFRPVKSSLDRGVKELDQAIKDKKEDQSLKPGEESRPRRWWKGCSQIAQGCMLSVANVSIALNAVDLPVSNETRTWGSIVSVTTGVGLIMSGVGDLRGE